MCNSPLQHSYNLYPLNMCVYMFFYICIYTPTHPHPHTPPKLAANCWELLYIKRYRTLILFHAARPAFSIFYHFDFWDFGSSGKIAWDHGILQERTWLSQWRKDGLATKLHWIRNPRLENLGWWHLKAAFQDFFSGFEVNSIESFPQLFARHPQGLPFRCTMGI